MEFSLLKMEKQTFQYKFYKSRTYILLTMQNSSTHIIFDDVEEAKHYTDNEFSKYKFSIIDQIDEIKRFDSSIYEFLLCYPELPICNRWLQKVSPIEYKENVSIVEDIDNIGYTPIDNNFDKFKGLMISKSQQSYLDGDADEMGHWHYAIGVYENYLEDYYLPGVFFDNDWVDFHSYELFLRVPNLRVTCIIQNNLQFSRYILLIYIFILSK